jgi:hypothetical protein
MAQEMIVELTKGNFMGELRDFYFFDGGGWVGRGREEWEEGGGKHHISTSFSGFARSSL